MKRMCSDCQSDIEWSTHYRDWICWKCMKLYPEKPIPIVVTPYLSPEYPGNHIIGTDPASSDLSK